MLTLLTEFKGKNLQFMFHAYSGSSEMVKRFADLGGYFSFSSSLFSPGNKRIASALLATPKERLMFESDTSNISGLQNTIASASRILSTPVEQLAEISFNNSVRFFKERI
jgi:Tat protein secretion system quality control protein TatD with DNase activity